MRPSIEMLEARQLLSANPSPIAPPTGSIKLTGKVIGTAGTGASAFDGNTSTYFNGPTSSGNWVGEDLGSPTVITQLQYYPRSGYASRMVGGIFQGSNVAGFSTGVVNLFTITKTPTYAGFSEQPIASTTAFRYVRYLAPTGSYGNVAELEFDGHAPLVASAAPAAPSALVDVTNTANDVSFSWTPDPYQPTDSFTIERQGPSDPAPVILGTVKGNTLSYNDPHVQGDTHYSYSVLATNNFGSSKLSNPLMILTPTALAGSTPLTGTIIGTSGSYLNHGNTIANVFDGNLNTYFDAPISGGAWVGLDLGSTNVITKIGFAPRSGYGSRMVGGVFQGSNTADFSSGVVDLSAIRQTPPSGIINFRNISGTAAYRYVRYLSPATGGSGNIAEMQVFGYPASQQSSGFPTGVSSWSAGAASPIVRAEGLGAVVNGVIYAFGGFSNQGSEATTIPLQTNCDSYNPATNTWKKLATFPEAFQDAPGVVVGDDVWYMGGFIGNYPGKVSDHVWIYNTDKDTWTRGPNLPSPRASAAASLVGSTIYLLGGLSTTETINSTLALDLNNQSAGWQSVAPLPAGRNHFAAVTLGGYLYAIGGQSGDGDVRTDQILENPQAEVDRYDPSTNTWTVVAPLPSYAGLSHIGNSVVVFDGRIIVVGGEIEHTIPQTDIVDYDPVTNTWSKLATLPDRRSTAIVAVENGKLFVVCGNNPYATKTVLIGTLTS
jgi:N-acetylneuraminic acid mutarotase